MRLPKRVDTGKRPKLRKAVSDTGVFFIQGFTGFDVGYVPDLVKMCGMGISLKMASSVNCNLFGFFAKSYALNLSKIFVPVLTIECFE